MKRLTPSFWSLVALALFSPLLPIVTAAEITEAAVQARFEKGQSFANDGFTAQALKEYLWCYDEGMVSSPRLKKMRAGMLIPAIKRIATDFGPAEEAMNKRCTDAETRLLAGEADAAGEFAAWCDALLDEKRMLKTFDKIPAGDPRRNGFGMPVFTPLVNKKRYADAVNAMPYEVMVRVVDSQTSRLSGPRASDEAREFAVNMMLDYIEALTGAKDAAHAEEMSAKLKAFDASAATKRAIEKRQKRAS